MWRVREWLALFWPHAWWYSWRRAAHVVRVTEAEAGGGFYGSMNLAEEEAWVREWDEAGLWQAARWLPAPPEPGWREQTEADLSPEALDVDDAIERASEMDRLAVAIEFGWLPKNSGPGVVPQESSPGPDPMWEYHADHPDSLPERVALPTLDLGPRAALALERYERRKRERWAWVEPARVDFTAVAA